MLHYLELFLNNDNVASTLEVEQIHFFDYFGIDLKNSLYFVEEDDEQHGKASTTTTTSITGVNDDPLKSYIKRIYVCQQLNRCAHEYTIDFVVEKGKKKTENCISIGKLYKDFQSNFFFLAVLS